MRKSHTEILEILKKTILKKNDVTVEAVKSNTKKVNLFLIFLIFVK